MKIETEGGLRFTEPPWGMVKSAIRLLAPEQGNGFAILSIGLNTYIQTLRETEGYLLEWRITGDCLDDYIHYRASAPKIPVLQAPDRWSHDDEAEPCADILTAEVVIDAFLAFFDRKGPPRNLAWRPLDL